MAQDPEMPLLLTKVPYYKLHSSWEQGYTPRDAMVRLKLNLD